MTTTGSNGIGVQKVLESNVRSSEYYTVYQLLLLLDKTKNKISYNFFVVHIFS